MSLHKITRVVLICLTAAGSRVGAVEVSLSVDVASANVFRGVTRNDGLVIQPGVMIEGWPVPLSLGIWGNMDIGDYDKTLEKSQFSEIEFHAAYALPGMPEGLRWEIGYTEYTYPLLGGPADRELSLVFGIDSPLKPALGVHYGVDGGIEKDLYLEAELSHVIASPAFDLALVAAVGYAVQDAGGSGFSHYVLSAAATWNVLTASIAYIGQLDGDVLSDEDYDVAFVGTLGLVLTF